MPDPTVTAIPRGDGAAAGRREGPSIEARKPSIRRPASPEYQKVGNANSGWSRIAYDIRLSVLGAIPSAKAFRPLAGVASFVRTDWAWCSPGQGRLCAIFATFAKHIAKKPTLDTTK
ncbi:hypothetical protein EN829_021630 [Mesorhizobium sp. M00.F.Ca.ET.186.01.1.1]|nr:hypothetical protein EN848_29460 [bacterium M00.F.Ca.ET.205.01.1.1]TGU50604.1 hypothetical protein EN795_23675 [bacterium M00.F.Ca.ET.152.01.1.1]TGV34061.1 hypothetical protein EN829_021630 [Mesorhizobium sp. M00.F.Ca.ET.186.01.1.1]TGZ40968.1 hypothetical protein EN805_23070 [bacterium M00.F.Ca.ET.162.01.1.1]